MTFEVLLEDAAATESLGSALGTLLIPGDVLLLVGDLGAGKTTLVRGLVAGLGGHDAVTSPTFTLRHEYATSPPLTHVDCWRLERVGELADLDLDEVLDEGGALVIEWGERARALFPGRSFEITLAELEHAPGRRALLSDRDDLLSGRIDELRRALRASALELHDVRSEVPS